MHQFLMFIPRIFGMESLRGCCAADKTAKESCCPMRALEGIEKAPTKAGNRIGGKQGLDYRFIFLNQATHQCRIIFNTFPVQTCMFINLYSSVLTLECLASSSPRDWLFKDSRKAMVFASSG